MGSFFRILTDKFSKKNNSASTEDAPKLSTLDLPVNPALQWSQLEFDLLAQHEQKRQLCHARVIGQTQDYQTFVLGFDLNTNKILLDSLFPNPPHRGSLLGRHLTVELQSEDSLLVLDIIPAQMINLSSGPVLTANIFSKELRNDRRREDRVAFDTYESPTSILHIPLEPQIEGSVLNLSSGGMLIKTLGFLPLSIYHEYAEGNAVRSDCYVNFSHDVQFKCKADIKQIDVLRKPCNHTLLRVVFDKVPLQQQELLTAFMAASSEKDPLWHSMVSQVF